VGGHVNFFLHLFDHQLIALDLHIWTTGGTVANLLLARGNLCALETLMFVLCRTLSCVNTKLLIYTEQNCNYPKDHKNRFIY